MLEKLIDVRLLHLLRLSLISYMLMTVFFSIKLKKKKLWRLSQSWRNIKKI